MRREDAPPRVGLTRANVERGHGHTRFGGETMNETKRCLGMRAAHEAEQMMITRLAVAEESVCERAARARQRFIPTPGRLAQQSGDEAVALLEVGEAAALFGMDRCMVQK
jgi:hypothetical protein